MARTFALKVDANEVLRRASGLSELTGGGLGEAIVTSLNETIDSAFDLTRDRISGYASLTDDYLRRRMRVEHATKAKPEASLIAPGSFITGLSHYDPVQNTAPVNWSNARIQAEGHKFGKWPGWTRRTGRTNVGIAVDRKGTGRSVQVVRGQRKRVATAFSIAGKADSEGNLIVFRRRKGSQKIEALLGPSVYQLFAYQLDGTLLKESEDALREALADQAEEALKRVLTT